MSDFGPVLCANCKRAVRVSKEDIWTFNWHCDHCGRHGQFENPSPPFPRPTIKKRSQMSAEELQADLREQNREITAQYFANHKKRFW